MGGFGRETQRRGPAVVFINKNSQRAEIVKRRGHELIAMFGDRNSDLRTGFYERGFKFQSSVTPGQD